MNRIKEIRKLHEQYTSGFDGEGEQKLKNNKIWLEVAAGLTIFMAIFQTVISISPSAAAYFQAPPKLLENRLLLFIIGEGAALILAIFSLYALSGAGSILRLPLLRIVLILISWFERHFK